MQSPSFPNSIRQKKKLLQAYASDKVWTVILYEENDGKKIYMDTKVVNSSLLNSTVVLP